ncbi:MAG TPA: histone deacetylase [Anaerolineales bacterium]|nr:histone deacetylase [Anaerolineales bacterium]
MDRLTFFYPEGHEAHAAPGHVERPDRLPPIRSALEKGGRWQQGRALEPADVSIDLLRAVHTEAYLARLEAAARSGSPLDPDTYTTPASFQVALNSAGGAIAVSRSVWEGESGRGFALCRPPGHHATRARGMGFCLLNNVALAAADLRLNRRAERLAIIDLDLHHGNGTQDIFYSRSDVFYLSTHQFPFYPGTGGLHETGEGEGAKTTANFPLPAGSGDAAVLTVLDRLAIPLLDRFQPEMLLVSAGFDPHWRDPLGNLVMSAGGFGKAVRLLADWADENCAGRIVLVLEGGYDLLAIAACASASTAALLGEDWDDPLGPAPLTEQSSWKEMVERASRLWGLDANL